jgi:hypothetical protein
VIRIAKKKMPYLQCINSRFVHNDSRLKNAKNAGFSRCDAAWQKLLSCMHRDDGKHACRCIAGHDGNRCTPASINGKPYPQAASTSDSYDNVSQHETSHTRLLSSCGVHRVIARYVESGR